MVDRLRSMVISSLVGIRGLMHIRVTVARINRSAGSCLVFAFRVVVLRLSASSHFGPIPASFATYDFENHLVVSTFLNSCAPSHF